MKLRTLWMLTIAFSLSLPLPGIAQSLAQLHLQAVNSYREKQYPQAIALWQKIIELDPKNSQAYYSLGLVYHRQQNWDRAIAAYTQAVTHDPNDSVAYNSLGIALRAQNRLDEAIVAYTTATTLNPKSATALNNLATALYEKKQIEAAIVAYKKAIDINPDDDTIYNNLGVALRAQNRLDEAIAIYTKATEINPNSANAFNNLGLALQEKNRTDAAITAFTKAIQINPDNAIAYDNLGNALSDKGKWKTAIAAYDKAIQFNPNNAYFYNNLGTALSHQGRLREAIAAYQQALNLPDNTTGKPTTAHALAHNNLGHLLKTQSKLEAAEQAFLAATQIDPNFKFALNNLKDVRTRLTKPIQLTHTSTQYLQQVDPSTRARRATVIITPIYTPEGQGSSGTGFVIKRQGDTLWILTNRHVIMDSWERSVPRITKTPEIQLYLGDKRKEERIQPLSGKVLHHTALDDPLDLALIELKAPRLPEDIQPLEFNLAPTDNLSIRAIGHPGPEEWAIGQGKLIDMSENQITLRIQFDKGNSGSPILDENNRVIGVANKMTDQTTGFALPMHQVLQKLQTWGVSIP
jgi:tetratricopeptide (TPR) repeat protein